MAVVWPTFARPALVYKLLKGLSPLVHHQAVSGLLPAGAAVPAPDAAALFAWAEAHGKLIGPHEVCAGSEAQIRRLLGAVVDGELPPGNAAAVEPELVEAGLAFAQFGLLRFLHRLARTVAVDEARPVAQAQLGPLSAALRAAASRDRAVLLEPIAEQQGTAEARALAHTWDEPAASPTARVEQIDRGFLAGCVPLCLRLRRALGHDERVPEDQLGSPLIDRLG